jgi:hypothetical protein
VGVEDYLAAMGVEELEVMVVMVGVMEFLVEVKEEGVMVREALTIPVLGICILEDSYR